MNPDQRAVTGSICRRHKFDPVAQITGHMNVEQLDLFDPLDLGGGKVGRTSECQGRQNGDLVGGIEAAHIG